MILPQLDGGESKVLTVAGVQLGQIPKYTTVQSVPTIYTTVQSVPTIYTTVHSYKIPDEAPVEPGLVLKLRHCEVVQLQAGLGAQDGLDISPSERSLSSNKKNKNAINDFC